MKDVEDAIGRLKRGRAAGESGLAAVHLQLLKYNGIAQLLTDVYNEVYTNPTKLNDIPELVRFRPIGIPKPDKNGIPQGLRLISIPEVPLKLFHSIIKRQLT